MRARAEMPACPARPGRNPGWSAGLLLLCRGFTTAPAIRTATRTGRDWPDTNIRFGRLASALPTGDGAPWDKIGQRTWSMPMTGRPGRTAILPGRLEPAHHPDHPQSRLSGLFPRSRCGGSARRKARSTSAASILRQAVLPQGRLIRPSPDHGQRPLTRARSRHTSSVAPRGPAAGCSSASQLTAS